MTPRQAVLQILLSVDRDHMMMSRALHDQLSKHQYWEKRDRAFVTFLAESTIKNRIYIDYLLDQVSDRPVHSCRPAVREILRMSAASVLFMDSVPDSAACNEAVKLARDYRGGRYVSFVNAVMRNFTRHHETGDFRLPDSSSDPDEYMSVRYSVPLWIVKLISKQYNTETALAVCRDSVERPLLTARIMTNGEGAKAHKKAMDSDGLETEAYRCGVNLKTALGEKVAGLIEEHAVIIKNINYVAGLESFRKGAFTVMDVASMIPAYAALSCAEYPVNTVVDLCAAPGGKCLQAREYFKDSTVTARDVSEARAELVGENAARLGLNIRVQVADASVKDSCLHADAVFTDVPCSGLGVLKRKKDIAYNQTPKALDDLVSLQRTILENAADYVNPGGILVYSTCTVNRKENSGQTDIFLKEHEEYHMVYRTQTIPGIMPCDGFYCAVMKRD